jgi:hypothetical protein
MASSLKASGLNAIGDDLVQLEKFSRLSKSNNLGLDEVGIVDLLKVPKGKGKNGITQQLF